MTENNVFDEMTEQSKVPQESVPHIEDNSNNETIETPITDEINLDSLSSTAVGEAKKYVREDLNGKEVKIFSAKMFNPDTENDDIISGMVNKDTKYYKTKFILTYDLENSDGVKHREYLSGAIQFIQKDGSISQPLLWFEGSKSQVGSLFVKVAEAKNIEPKDLSPREFMNFLNSGPKALLKTEKFEFAGNVANKNLVEKFI